MTQASLFNLTPDGWKPDSEAMAVQQTEDHDVDWRVRQLRAIDAARIEERRLERPKRRMPSGWTIARYWASRSEFLVDLEEPECFACGVVYDWGEDFHEQTPRQRWTKAEHWLQRAHIVARVYHGLDGPQNLALLCELCHRYQPDNSGKESIAYIQAGGVGWGESRIAAIRGHDPRKLGLEIRA